MNHNYGINIEALLSRPRAERESILFDLVNTGRLDRRVCHMLLAELDMREEARNCPDCDGTGKELLNV